MPDILNNDPAPFDALDPGSEWDFMAWLGKHGGETVLPVLDKVIPALKSSGITTLAALGFCYGARPAFDLAFVNTVSVVVVSHPSLLKVPEDMEVLTRLCCLCRELTRVRCIAEVQECLKGAAPHQQL